MILITGVDVAVVAASVCDLVPPQWQAFITARETPIVLILNRPEFPAFGKRCKILLNGGPPPRTRCIPHSENEPIMFVRILDCEVKLEKQGRVREDREERNSAHPKDTDWLS